MLKLVGVIFFILILILAIMEEDKINNSLQDLPASSSTSDWIYMSPDEWWDATPEGQHATKCLMSGELSVQDMEFIFNKMGEGKSYYESRKRIGIFLPSLRRLGDNLEKAWSFFLELG